MTILVLLANPSSEMGGKSGFILLTEKRMTLTEFHRTIGEYKERLFCKVSKKAKFCSLFFRGPFQLAEILTL
jgi:hypothetical protein